MRRLVVCGAGLVLGRCLLHGAARLGPLLEARHDLVDAQQHGRGLDRGLERLRLDGEGLPHAQLAHVDQLARVAVDAPGAVALRVLGLHPHRHEHIQRERMDRATYAQLRDDADDVGAAVLSECARNDLHCLAHGAVRILRLPSTAWLFCDRPTAICKAKCKETSTMIKRTYGHFVCTAARHKARVQQHVAGNAHGVLQLRSTSLNTSYTQAAQTHTYTHNEQSVTQQNTNNQATTAEEQ